MERGATGFKVEGADLLKKVQFKEKNGKKYYRVTSILEAAHPSERQVPEEQLIQYGARGTLAHLEATLMLGEGISLDEKRAALKTLEDGDLGLTPIEPRVIKDFMLKYPEFDWSNPIAVERELWDDKLMLSGTPDLFVRRKGRLCLCDWKTASNYSTSVKEKYFKQMGAYSLMWELAGGDPVEEFYILPLKPNNKYGYGAPYTTTEVKKYQALFMEDYKSINPNI